MSCIDAAGLGPVHGSTSDQPGAAGGAASMIAAGDPVAADELQERAACMAVPRRSNRHPARDCGTG